MLVTRPLQHVSDLNKGSITAQAARIIFRGVFMVPDFLEFAEHRARRLNIQLEVKEAAPSEIGVHVSGAPELIDAFEIACSLGPYDCLVLDLVRENLPGEKHG